MTPSHPSAPTKRMRPLTIVEATHPTPRHVLLRLTDEESPLPDSIQPGQFVEVRVSHSPQTFLRRPISINFVDRERNELWLLIHQVGAGTRALAALQRGARLDCLFPLGHGFRPISDVPPRPLLVGGGIGTAPLLYFGYMLHAAGNPATFLLGGRTRADILQVEEFGKYGTVLLTTEDGSAGERGFVTNHPAFTASYGYVGMCGPKAMMQAVARQVAQWGDIPCEASLENLMACGLGACLCCVEKTTQGHLCVCTEGPVFDTKRLLW